MSRLDDDVKGVVTTDTLGGRQELSAINESGLILLILTICKGAAGKFREVGYDSANPAMTIMDRPLRLL